MTNQKLLFFDIDGTLVGFDGIIPDSAWKALAMARQAGHLLFLCTGRSRHQIYQFLLDYGFDGIVGSTGGYVEWKGQEIYHTALGRDRLVNILDCFLGTDTGMIFEMKDGCVCTSPSESQFLKIYQEKVDNISDMRQLDAFASLMLDEDLSSYPDKYPGTESIIYLNSPYNTDQVRSKLSPDIHVDLASFKAVPDPYSGEITLSSNSKQTGIQRLLDHLGKVREDVIAFGDGANDRGMLEFAGTAVVMGNAGKEIRAFADYVTDPVNADGIYHAMRHLKLIDE